MKITTRVRYGLRAILQIAASYNEGPVSVNSIANTQDISGKYLEQLLSSLRKANLVVGHRGVRGGYTLGRAPEDISLRDVLMVLDTKPELLDCVPEPKSCNRADSCPMRDIWGMLNERLAEFWGSFTLATLLERVSAKGFDETVCDLRGGEGSNTVGGN